VGAQQFGEVLVGGAEAPGDVLFIAAPAQERRDY